MEGILVFYFGVDSVTGTLFDENGLEAVTVRKEIKLMINEEYVEQDPREWLSNVTLIIDEVQSTVEQPNIGSILITYQPGTFLCIDRAGEPITYGILNCDRRAKYQFHLCEKTIKKHSDSFNIPWSNMILPKIQWIKYNKPDVYKNIFKILTPDSFIAYKLSGEAAIDNYSAQFLGYNMNYNDYNVKLLSNLGLESYMMPDVGRFGECIGFISGSVRDELKLKSDVKILVSTSCLTPLLQMACITDNNTGIFDIDSSNICFRNNNAKIKNDDRLLKHSIKDMTIYSIMGNYEVLFLNWIYKFLNDTNIEDVNYTPGSNGVMVLPNMIGDSCFYKSDVKGSIIGLSNGSRFDIMSAAYEAIGYVLNNHIEHISHYDTPLDSIEILCEIKDDLFYQILSDITSKKIILRNRTNSLIKIIYEMLVKKDCVLAAEVDVLVPDEEKNHKYKQFISLYKSAYNSLSKFYGYRRKILRRINP